MLPHCCILHDVPYALYYTEWDRSCIRGLENPPHVFNLDSNCLQFIKKACEQYK